MNTRRGFLQALTGAVFAVALDVLPSMGFIEEEVFTPGKIWTIPDIMPIIADYYFKSGPIISYIESR